MSAYVLSGILIAAALVAGVLCAEMAPIRIRTRLWREPFGTRSRRLDRSDDRG